MQTARQNTRGEDLKLIKRSLHLIRDFDPPIKGHKEMRGFNNDQTAALLIPAGRQFDTQYVFNLL